MWPALYGQLISAGAPGTRSHCVALAVSSTRSLLRIKGLAGYNASCAQEWQGSEGFLSVWKGSNHALPGTSSWEESRSAWGGIPAVVCKTLGPQGAGVAQGREQGFIAQGQVVGCRLSAHQRFGCLCSVSHHAAYLSLESLSLLSSEGVGLSNPHFLSPFTPMHSMPYSSTSFW